MVISDAHISKMSPSKGFLKSINTEDLFEDFMDNPIKKTPFSGEDKENKRTNPGFFVLVYFRLRTVASCFAPKGSGPLNTGDFSEVCQRHRCHRYVFVRLQWSALYTALAIMHLTSLGK